MKWFLSLLLCFWVGVGYAEELPMPGGSPPVEDHSYWHKWDTPNFIILSLNDRQGQQIAQQIEMVRDWVTTRWGLPPAGKPKTDGSISPRTKVLCVPDRAVLKKLFRLGESYAEVRHAANGRIETSTCWILCDDTLSNSLSILLTEICLSELEQDVSDAYNVNCKICYWARRGMSILNGEPSKVRLLMAPMAEHIASNKKMYFSEPLFTLSKDVVARSSEENIALFDREAALLCLMIRKEFGQRAFLALLMNSSPDNLYRATGYRSYADFDFAFKRYLYYAAYDVVQGRMPAKYLDIQPVGGYLKYLEGGAR